MSTLSVDLHEDCRHTWRALRGRSIVDWSLDENNNLHLKAKDGGEAVFNASEWRAFSL